MTLVLESFLLSAGSVLLAFYILLNLFFKIRGSSFYAYAGILSLVCWIIIRAVTAGHAPFAGMYESMVFFAFLYAVKIVLLSRFPEKIKAFALVPAVLIMAGAFLMPEEMKIAGEGPPALESFWIWFHVPGIFIGYAALTIGLVLTILGQAGLKRAEDYLEPEMKQAFYFTAFGIITGGFWAQLSWGTFWSWDPKETWALFTLILLILERHAGKIFLRRAFIYAAALTMLFNYFGVTFLLSGLHSYR